MFQTMVDSMFLGQWVDEDCWVSLQSILSGFDRRYSIDVSPNITHDKLDETEPTVTVAQFDTRLLVRKRSVLSRAVCTELFFYVFMAKVNMDMLLMAQLPHVFDIHVHGQVVDMFMENLPISFFDMFDPLPNHCVVVRRLRQLVTIVHHLHTHHIYHRDIKPHNIRFRPDGTLVLIDFDSCAFGSRCQSDFPVGTIGYRPPELLLPLQSGPIVYDAQSVDIFNVGMTLVAMVNGGHPLIRCEASSDPMHVRRETTFHINEKLLHHTGLIVALGPLYDVCLAMIDIDPSHRPSLKDVLCVLKTVEPLNR